MNRIKYFGFYPKYDAVVVTRESEPGQPNPDRIYLNPTVSSQLRICTLAAKLFNDGWPLFPSVAGWLLWRPLPPLPRGCTGIDPLTKEEKRVIGKYVSGGPHG